MPGWVVGFRIASWGAWGLCHAVPCCIVVSGGGGWLCAICGHFGWTPPPIKQASRNEDLTWGCPTSSASHLWAGYL